MIESIENASRNTTWYYSLIQKRNIFFSQSIIHSKRSSQTSTITHSTCSESNFSFSITMNLFCVFSQPTAIETHISSQKMNFLELNEVEIGTVFVFILKSYYNQLNIVLKLSKWLGICLAFTRKSRFFFFKRNSFVLILTNWSFFGFFPQHTEFFNGNWSKKAGEHTSQNVLRMIGMYNISHNQTWIWNNVMRMF